AGDVDARVPIDTRAKRSLRTRPAYTGSTKSALRSKTSVPRVHRGFRPRGRRGGARVLVAISSHDGEGGSGCDAAEQDDEGAAARADGNGLLRRPDLAHLRGGALVRRRDLPRESGSEGLRLRRFAGRLAARRRRAPCALEKGRPGQERLRRKTARAGGVDEQK